MTESADAILKGMLKIGISESNHNNSSSENDHLKDSIAANTRKKAAAALMAAAEDAKGHKSNANAAASSGTTSTIHTTQMGAKTNTQLLVSAAAAASTSSNGGTASGNATKKEKGRRTSRGKPRAGSRGKQTTNHNSSHGEQVGEVTTVPIGGGGEGGDSLGAKIGEKSSEKGGDASAKKKRKKKNANRATVKEGDRVVAATSTSSLQQKNTKNSSHSSMMTTATSTYKDNTAPDTTTNNYAWSAFQSSPDPRALPDIGGLFGNDSVNDEATITKGMVEVAGEKKPEESDGRGGEEGDEEGGDEDADAGEDNVDLGSPSADIRESLVHSMIAKNTLNAVSTGEELLKRLHVDHRKGGAHQRSESSEKNRNGDGVDRRFRTMESLEAELMSPPKKDVSKADQETKVETEGDDEAAGNSIETRGTSTAGLEERRSNYQYRDPITELMNPGGHPGGFGMPIHHQPPPFAMPYHPPLHYAGMHPHQPQQPHPQQHVPYHHPPPLPQHHHHHHPMQQHSYPGFPYPPPSPPPMYPSPNTLPPGFTTMQVRVPNVLGPGNTMLVHGMSFVVPEGVPPGTIIPVMIPIHPPGPGGGYPNPADARHYSMNYNYQHAQQQQQQHLHMMQHSPSQNVPPPHMMGGYYQNHNPQQQYPQSQIQQQQPPPAEMNPNSWAAKAAGVTPSKTMDTDTSTAGKEIPPSPANTAVSSASNPETVAISGGSKGGRTRSKKEGSGSVAAAAAGAGTGGTSNKSKDEVVSSYTKRSGRKKQQQEGRGDNDGTKGSNGARKDGERK